MYVFVAINNALCYDSTVLENKIREDLTQATDYLIGEIEDDHLSIGYGNGKDDISGVHWVGCNQCSYFLMWHTEELFQFFFRVILWELCNDRTTYYIQAANLMAPSGFYLMGTCCLLTKTIDIDAVHLTPDGKIDMDVLTANHVKRLRDRQEEEIDWEKLGVQFMRNYKHLFMGIPAEYVHFSTLSSFMAFVEKYKTRIKCNIEKISLPSAQEANWINFRQQQVRKKRPSKLQVELFSANDGHDYLADEFDFRDEVFTGDDGRVGLRSVKGEILLPAVYDAIPEILDDYYESCYRRCCPVVLNGKYGLVCKEPSCPASEREMLPNIYNHIFRLTWMDEPFFVCEKDGKMGVVDANNPTNEILPCENDVIYEPVGGNGPIVFQKGLKFGAYHEGVITHQLYEHIKLPFFAFEHIQFRNGEAEEWFWIDQNGQPTDDESQAVFSPGYDWD